MAKNELNSNATGIALAGVTLLAVLAGLVWHGPMGQPTMMALMYPGFSWLNPFGLLIGAAAAVLGYVTGYVFAWIYNWALKI